jgi:ribokinase
MITVVGSINLDVVAMVEHFPRAGETVVAGSFRRTHGGKGANQAVAAARLGAIVEFVGCVGEDPVAEELVAGLVDEGVGVRNLRSTVGPSGLAMITIDGEGENSIVVGRGANDDVRVDAEVSGLLGSSTISLCQLEIPITAVRDALHATGGTTILNAAPAVRLPRDVLDAVDVLIVNEVELRTLVGSTEPGAARGLGIATVVTTLGARGAQVVTRSDVGYVRAPSAHVADTTGAGDAFCGTFAVAIDEGLDVFDATARGVAAGSLATTKVGAREAMPTRDALDRTIARM